MTMRYLSLILITLVLPFQAHATELDDYIDQLTALCAFEQTYPGRTNGDACNLLAVAEEASTTITLLAAWIGEVDESVKDVEKSVGDLEESVGELEVSLAETEESFRDVDFSVTCAVLQDGEEATCTMEPLTSTIRLITKDQIITEASCLFSDFLIQDHGPTAAFITYKTYDENDNKVTSDRFTCFFPDNDSRTSRLVINTLTNPIQVYEGYTMILSAEMGYTDGAEEINYSMAVGFN